MFKKGLDRTLLSCQRVGDWLLTTMTDQMDVDIPTSSSSGGISASSSSSEKLDITELDLETLNNRMKTFCEDELWRTRINMAIGDASSRWRTLISNVLSRLMRELEATNMKDSFINSSDANAIVERLDDDGLQGWKAGVRDGVEKNDWTTLIWNRTHICITRRLDHV